MGTQPTCSTRSKAKEQRLKRHIAALRRRLNRHTETKVVEATSSTMVAVIDRQPMSILDLLEDDLSHGSIGANSGAEEASKRAYFV
jgi:type II secretory pathway component PulJ